MGMRALYTSLDEGVYIVIILNIICIRFTGINPPVDPNVRGSISEVPERPRVAYASNRQAVVE